MAAPHVSGLAGLVWATSWGTSNQAVVDRIKNTADRIPGTGTFWTSGRINAAAAVAPPKATLTISKSGGGNGVVSSTPAGISCGVTCSASFDLGTTLVLGATADSGSIFGGWNSPCNPTPTGCSVMLNGDTTMQALFAPQPAIGSAVMAVWRLHKIPNHLFTASAGERDSAINQFGWTLEGVGFCVPNAFSAGLQPVFRLNKGNEFLYTFSAGERDNAVAQYGYVAQGTAFFANQSPGTGLTPVHRLNNGLEHIYIQDPGEIQVDITQFGYRDEGIALYAPPCS
jgi:hypothetical protein